MKRILFILMFTVAALVMYGSGITAVCNDDQVSLIDNFGHETARVAMGETVTLLSVGDTDVEVESVKGKGFAGREHFKIRYESGVQILTDLMKIKKYKANETIYRADDMVSLKAAAYFLDRSFGITYNDLLSAEIYAHHGFIFNNTLFRDVFTACSWYQPDKRFSELEFNGYELKNLELLKPIPDEVSNRNTSNTNSLIVEEGTNAN